MPNEHTDQSGIYCIRNVVSGRAYVGSAICIRIRWNMHRHLLNQGRHHSATLNRSWQKHGSESFVFGILESVSNAYNLIDREQFWIDKLNSACPKTGFNMYRKAGSPLGFKHSAEACSKMSEDRKGRKHSDEAKEKIRVAKIKLYALPEMREKLREQSLNGWESRRLSGAQLGFPHTEESKIKLSLAKTGKMTDAHKASIAASNRRRSLLHR